MALGLAIDDGRPDGEDNTIRNCAKRRAVRCPGHEDNELITTNPSHKIIGAHSVDQS